jgi:hypothetical protein
MATFDSVRVAVWVIGIPVIVALLVSIARRARAVRDEIARVREEAARNPGDPYAQMARLYEARELLDKGRREAVAPRPSAAVPADEPPPSKRNGASDRR